MFDFIRNMFLLGKINRDKVFLYVPKYITMNQAQMIVGEADDKN